MNAAVETINGAGGAFVKFAVPMLVQSSVLIVLLLLVDAVLRKRVRAVFRYWIWMLVLVKLVLPPSLWSPVSIGRWLGDSLRAPTAAVLEFADPQPAGPAPEARPGAADVLSQDVPVSVTASAPAREGRYPEASYSPGARQSDVDSEPPAGATAISALEPRALSLTWQGFTLLSWAAVATCLLLLLLQRSVFVRGLVTQAEEASAAMQDSLNHCRIRMGLRRDVGLKLSAIAGSPAACGLIHPVILIPQSLAPRLQSHDLQAVLLHELAHIKRGDLWINLVQTLLQIVCFYNPLLWLANAMIRRTREQAVDEAVLVTMGEHAQQYPETLLNIAKLSFRKRPALSLRLIGVVESRSALSARIKHILTRPIPKSAKLGLLGLLAILIIAIVLLPMAQMLEPHATVVNDGPLDIRFIGVCPDQSGDILDGDGEKIETTPCAWIGQAAWRADALRRDFMFELPEANVPIVFSHRQLISVAGEDAELHQSQTGLLFQPVIHGQRIATMETYIPQVYRKELLGLIRVHRVDVALKYFYGPPRATLLSFQGPFTEGQVLASKQMSGAKLMVLPERADGPQGERRAYFRLDLPFKMDRGTPVLIYDAEGRRHVACAISTSIDRKSTTIEFLDHLERTPLSKVARIAVEKPYAFTVRNVRVNYPDRSPRDHAPYLDVMAQRLGWTGTPEQLAQRQILNPQDAIKVIDIVPAGRIMDALRFRLGRSGLSDLDRATQEKIHQVAARWADCDSTSHYGIQLGLIGRWPEFFDMAIDRLGRDYQAGQDAFHYGQTWLYENRAIASTLSRHWIELNAAQAEELKGLILGARDGPMLHDLFMCLWNAKRDVVAEPLWELAQDDRPWIWWAAVEAWRTKTARSEYNDLPEKIKLRLFLVEGAPGDEGLKAKALALLPQLFTPELGRMASDVWNKVRERIAREFDRKAATDAYLNYLRQMQSAMTERQWAADDGFRQDSIWMVAYVIRTLNVWYGIDIGHLGTEETGDSFKTEPKTLGEFQNLIAQALSAVSNPGEVPVLSSEESPSGRGDGGEMVAKAAKPGAAQKENGLEKLLAEALPGSVVTVPAGRYTRPIEITRAVVLRGESQDRCIIEVTADQPAILVTNVGKGDVTIENLTIRWQLATDKKVELPAAVLVRDEDALIRNCRFVPLGDAKRSPMAVYIDGRSKSVVDNCRFNGFEYTICYGQGTEGIVQDCIITDCGHQGVINYDGATLTVQRNIITGSKFHAVRCTGGTLHVKDNLLIKNANRGIYLGNKSGRGTITNNLIVGNGTGISGFGRADYAIANNGIVSNDYAGIDMRDSCRLSIRNNVLAKNQRGIMLHKEGTENYNVIAKNAYWANATDVENMDKPQGSVTVDPQFADPNQGDFSVRGPAQEQGHGLANPSVIRELWEKYRQLPGSGQREPAMSKGAEAESNKQPPDDGNSSLRSQ